MRHLPRRRPESAHLPGQTIRRRRPAREEHPRRNGRSCARDCRIAPDSKTGIGAPSSPSGSMIAGLRLLGEVARKLGSNCSPRPLPADARLSPLGPTSHEPADRNRRNAARRIWSAVDRSSRQVEGGGSVGAGGAGTDFLRLTGAAFLTAAFLTATFLPAAFFATAFFGAAFFAGFFPALFFTAALRVAFLATTLRAVGLTEVFGAAFLAGDFFAATFFVIFFAAAFAIVISPSRLIPSCENAF